MLNRDDNSSPGSYFCFGLKNLKLWSIAKMAKIIRRGLIKAGDPKLYQDSLISPLKRFSKVNKKKKNKSKKQ